jgi:predicted transcriptional regulator
MATRESSAAVYKAMEAVLRQAAEIGTPITVKDLAQHVEVRKVAKSEQEVKQKVHNLQHANLVKPSKVDPALGHRGRIGYVWKQASKTYESVFKARSIPGKGVPISKLRKKAKNVELVRLVVFGVAFDLPNVNINIGKLNGKVQINID